MGDVSTTQSLTEQSRSVALKFCEHVNARRFDLVAEMFTDEASWWVFASKEWGGSANAKQRAAWAADLLGTFEEWSYVVENATADGNSVVIRGTSRGRGPGVVKYDNVYLMHFTISEDGKVVDFEEAMDCYQVDAWFESKEMQKEAETRVERDDRRGIEHGRIELGM